jgi:hypothetical protein
MINPVSTYSQQDMQFSADITKSLNQIESLYVEKMASRKYLDIPTSIPNFLTLNETMLNAISKQKNTSLQLLLKIARDGMDGALHSRTLYVDNADLDIQVLMLKKKIDDILSGKNEVSVHADTCGQFVITKTFKLAPIYSYYIHLYGMPAYGVGFDATKLSLLTTILKKYQIKPCR